MKEYKAQLKKSAPKANPNEPFHVYGWAAAATMVEALKGMKEPTRDELMKSVRNMDTEIPILLPGVKVKTSGESDGYPLEAMQIQQFDGKNWQLAGRGPGGVSARSRRNQGSVTVALRGTQRRLTA